MRKVDRGSIDIPEVFLGPNGKAAKELAKVKAHRSNPATAEKSFPFKVYKDKPMKAVLEQLFHGKCAYCETLYNSQAPVDVEHYRPKGAVEGADTHPGYWWLGMIWTNLLPSCIDCNRKRGQLTPVPGQSLGRMHEVLTTQTNTGKKDAFPIAGQRAESESDNLLQEEALLIDPTRDDPDDFLEYHLEADRLISLVLGIFQKCWHLSESKAICFSA